MREYGLYAKDILDAMEAIEKFVGNMTFHEFAQDDKTSSAVIRKFEIIGMVSRDSMEGNGGNARQCKTKSEIGNSDKIED